MIMTDFLKEFYDYVVDVKRETASGVSDSGETIKGAKKVVISGLKCTFQSNSDKIVIPEFGTAARNDITLISSLVDIRSGDIVTVISSPFGRNDGNDFLVTGADVFTMNGITHTEATLEGGVMQ